MSLCAPIFLFLIENFLPSHVEQFFFDDQMMIRHLFGAFEEIIDYCLSSYYSIIAHYLLFCVVCARCRKREEESNPQFFFENYHTKLIIYLNGVNRRSEYTHTKKYNIIIDHQFHSDLVRDEKMVQGYKL